MGGREGYPVPERTSCVPLLDDRRGSMVPGLEVLCRLGPIHKRPAPAGLAVVRSGIEVE